VNQVAVNVDESRFAGGFVDDVRVPDFFIECAWRHGLFYGRIVTEWEGKEVEEAEGVEEAAAKLENRNTKFGVPRLSRRASIARTPPLFL